MKGKKRKENKSRIIKTEVGRILNVVIKERIIDGDERRNDEDPEMREGTEAKKGRRGTKKGREKKQRSVLRNISLKESIDAA